MTDALIEAVRIWCAALIVETRHVPRMRWRGLRAELVGEGKPATDEQMQRSKRRAARFYSAHAGMRGIDVLSVQSAAGGLRWEMAKECQSEVA